MTTFLPTEDPLERFVQIADALERQRRFWQSPMFLRYAAVTLTTTTGSPAQLADAVLDAAETLRKRAGWFGSMVNATRFVVAAMLVRDDADANRFHDEMERTRALFRQVGLRRGPTFEVIAALMLWLGRAQHSVGEPDVRRLSDVYAGMREHHPWLTGPDDYAMCAMLALRGEPRHAQMQRIERIYRALRAAGLSAGNQLQLLSHLLFFNPAPDDVVVRRFLALRDRFRSAGVSIWVSDHDELALLTYAEAGPHDVVQTVLRHRARLRQMRPRPDATLSFSLAASTGFLASLGPQFERAAHDAQLMTQIQQILAAQQAAAVACMAAAGAAAASAAH